MNPDAAAAGPVAKAITVFPFMERVGVPFRFTLSTHGISEYYSSEHDFHCLPIFKLRKLRLRDAHLWSV